MPLQWTVAVSPQSTRPRMSELVTSSGAKSSGKSSDHFSRNSPFSGRNLYKIGISVKIFIDLTFSKFMKNEENKNFSLHPFLKLKQKRFDRRSSQDFYWISLKLFFTFPQSVENHWVRLFAFFIDLIAYTLSFSISIDAQISWPLIKWTGFN